MNKDKTQAALVPSGERMPTTIEEMPANPTAGQILLIAIQREASPEALEKLVALHERIEAKQAEKAFNAAMLSFQNSCPVILKNAKGHVSRYASFDYVAATIRPHAEHNGLSWSFEHDTAAPENSIRMVMTIRHTAGHSQRFVGPLFPCDPASKSMNQQQAVCSAESYAMRRTLLAGFGIATGEDADGTSDAQFINEEQIANIQALIEETGTDRGRFLQFIGADQVGHIPRGSYDKAVRALNDKRRRG